MVLGVSGWFADLVCSSSGERFMWRVHSRGSWCLIAVGAGGWWSGYVVVHGKQVVLFRQLVLIPRCVVLVDFPGPGG